MKISNLLLLTIFIIITVFFSLSSCGPPKCYQDLNPCDSGCEKLTSLAADSTLCHELLSNGDTIYYICNELVYNFIDGETHCKDFRKIDSILLVQFVNEVNPTLFSQLIAQPKYNLNALESAIDTLIKENSICLAMKLKIAESYIDTNLYNKFLGVANDSGNQDSVIQIYVAENLIDTTAKKVINGTLKPCLCEKEIYLYTNPIINAEDGSVAEASNKHPQIGGEGNSVSKNYIIKNDGDLPPKFARNIQTVQSRYINFESDTNTIKRAWTQSDPLLIAFLDTGLDPDVFNDSRYKYYLNQPTCLPRDDYGWNFIDNDNITHDLGGHGSLVAKSFLYVLETNNLNNLPYSVLPVKVLDSCGIGNIFSITCGLYYAQAKGAKLINASWGLHKDVEVLSKAISELSIDGIHMVCSSGNTKSNLLPGDTHHYPSEYSNLNPNLPHIDQFSSVYEVSGLCLSYDTIENTNINNALWFNTNFNKNNIVENATGFERLINNMHLDHPNKIATDTANCSCSGTSYAAPQITAALLHQYETNSKQFPDSLYLETNVVYSHGVSVGKSYWNSAR